MRKKDELLKRSFVGIHEPLPPGHTGVKEMLAYSGKKFLEDSVKKIKKEPKTELLLITESEIGEIIELTEDMSIEEDRKKLVDIARKRMDVINNIRARKLISGWDSTRVIGVVEKRFDQLKRKKFDWCSFYNGWIEGRFAMLAELDKK